MDENEAQAWEAGCSSDPIRNQFLIPNLVDLFTRERSTKILDVGSGTGYIPRKVDGMLGYRPEWTLVDTDPQRMSVATSSKPPEMQMLGVVGRIDSTELECSAYDAVLLTFTLLEAEKPALMLEDITSLVAVNGLLVVAVPDGWKDIIDASNGNLTLSQRFLKTSVELPKIDKFTGSPYPFCMMRIESLISTVLQRQFVLEVLEQGGCDGDVYMLVFRKLRSIVPSTSNA